MHKLIYTELITENPKATADFVGKLFGWEIQKYTDPKMEYYMWNYPGEKMGGGGIGKANQMGDKRGPRIDIYVDVDNISDTIERATRMGATQLVGETAIGGDMGYFAMIQIPGGVVLGLWAKQPSVKKQPQESAAQRK